MSKKVIIILMTLVIVGCQHSKIPKDLQGDWNAFYIFYEGEDILENYGARTVMTSFLGIYEKTFEIENFDGLHIFGSIDFNEEEFFIIKDCNDSRLDGNYKVELKKEVKSNGRYKNYYMKLISDRVTIVAEKYSTDFSIKDDRSKIN